jgi:hypothetical protein
MSIVHDCYQQVPIRIKVINITIMSWGVSQRGDWKSGILFMLKVVEVTSTITFQKINDLRWSVSSQTTYNH